MKKTVLKNLMSIALVLSMLASLVVIPASAEAIELPDWEVVLDPVYEMNFSPDADGKFYDSPAGTEGRQEIATEANPEDILLGSNNVGNKIISIGESLDTTNGTNQTRVSSRWAQNNMYSAISKGDTANDVNTGASGNVDDYCVKLVDANASGGPGVLKIDFPQAYGAATDSHDKYRVEFDWKWQAYYSNSGVLTPTVQPSSTGATLFRFYVGGKEINLTSRGNSDTSGDVRGVGAMYLNCSGFGLNGSGQITNDVDSAGVTKSASQIPDSESGKWIHITVDFDFEDGTIDLLMEGETTVRQLSTVIGSGEEDFANGITGIGILGSTSSDRRVNYADNVKITPISRPEVDLSAGEVLGENAYFMDFSPDSDGNLYDSPEGTEGRRQVPFDSETGYMGIGSLWSGTNETKVSSRFAKSTSYAEYSKVDDDGVSSSDGNDYCVKSVDKSSTDNAQIVKIDFPKTYGASDDANKKYRVEMDWKCIDTSSSAPGATTVANLYIGNTSQSIQLATRSAKTTDTVKVNGTTDGYGSFHMQSYDATGTCPFYLKEANQRDEGEYAAAFSSEESGSWIHLTFDLDFKNCTIDLTMKGGSETRTLSAEIPESSTSARELFSAGICGVGLVGTNKALTTRTNYIDNVSVTPIMTKEPAIKANGNKLFWKDITGASSYNVYASSTADGAKDVVTVKSFDTTSNPGYVIATLDFSDDSAKYYTVTATSSNKGESYDSKALYLAPQNLISDVDFEITSAADGLATAKATVNVDAAKGFDKKIKLIAAVYDDGALVKLSESDLTSFVRGTEDTIETSLTELSVPSNNMYIKFLVWDEEITPVKTAEELSSAKWREKLESFGDD